MTYKCCFPGCEYTTENRSLIEYHHIHPRELHVQHSRNVTIPLCATHHKLIYHPEATSGQHAEKHAESMIVKSVTNSNVGRCVIFQDMKGDDHSMFIDDMPIQSKVFVIGWNVVDGLYESEIDDADEYVMDAVDKFGYYKDGFKVYYTEKNKRLAADLLQGIIAVYQMKVSSEYDEIKRKISDALAHLG